jgi:adenosylhomocysteine nucleosidase
MGPCGARWSGSGRTVMPRKYIAVVAAMRLELEPLLRRVRGRQENGVEFFELENAVVAVGGIGRSAARRATEAAIARYQPSAVVSAGMGGAVTTSLKVGDVIYAREVVDADSGTRFVAGEGDAVVVTTGAVSGPSEKRATAECWKADVVDMEAAVVAELALERGIEFAAIKAISDELDFVMPPVAQFVDSSGRFETVRFAIYVAMRPQWWAAVRRLNANSRVAAVNLSDAIRHLIDQRSLTALEGKISGA